jgi:hypothetical protein
VPQTNPYFPDFDYLRQWRQQHYADWDPAAAPRRRRAVLTMARDEAVFLPIWLRYYSRFFASEDIYVLDHDTRDGSTSIPGFNRIKLAHPTYDIVWMLERLSELEAELLRTYDVVVMCDADEIFAPDPDSATPDLGVYLDRFDEEFVNPIGYEVVHQRDSEAPIDFARPLMAQRSSWARSSIYDKPGIASVPLDRVPGLHRRTDGENNYDPDLRLIHLHRIDFEHCWARHQHFAAVRHAERDIQSGLGSHNRIADRAEFERWFDTKLDGTPLELEPIEPRWHSVI